ncbi:hypothetical protein [Pseudomonas sp. EA_5y_Pfl2_R50]|uniref:hypothetical protein n=1 Tax=Pseudomonas sp. EA_5y_Pfl2_R50 TaxID=3088691 RepID=UPI0030DC327B
MKLFLFLTFAFSAAVNAMSGQALVADLNAKYQSNVAQCSNGTPAYYCSGILLRGVDYSTFFKFWDYGSKATKLGSVAFTYIRSDIGSTAVNGNRKSGFILKDQTSALADGKALHLRCVFPFPTESLDVRADHGCGFAPKVAKADPDLANCAKLWGSPTTAAAWLKNFKEHDSLPKNQCSLSTVVAAQFKASLEAHKLVNAIWTAKPTEVLVKTWDESKPEALPIEAVFYDASVPGKLGDAQKFQREYYLATSLYLPIVKLDLTAPDKNVFSFSSAEQVYGQTVAQQLNARFSNVSNDCAGNAAYFCSGVLIRTTKATKNYHAWDPSSGSILRDGVSFSFLRKDVKMKGLYISEKQGFVFKSTEFAIKSRAHPINVRCSFPGDGATGTYRKHSCGRHKYYPNEGDSCEEMNILTLSAWRSHYHSVTGTANRFYHQCALGPNREQFTIFVQGRSNFEYAADLAYTNEVVTAAWPPGIPQKLPLEAFVYVYSANPVVALDGARFMQNDYYEQTSNYLPVIRLTFDGEDALFSFHAAEQSVSVVGK